MNIAPKARVCNHSRECNDKIRTRKPIKRYTRVSAQSTRAIEISIVSTVSTRMTAMRLHFDHWSWQNKVSVKRSLQARGQQWTAMETVGISNDDLSEPTGANRSANPLMSPICETAEFPLYDPIGWKWPFLLTADTRSSIVRLSIKPTFTHPEPPIHGNHASWHDSTLSLMRQHAVSLLACAIADVRLFLASWIFRYRTCSPIVSPAWRENTLRILSKRQRPLARRPIPIRQKGRKEFSNCILELSPRKDFRYLRT